MIVKSLTLLSLCDIALNSTEYRLIQIEKPDREIEGVELFQSRIGSNSFGAKVAHCF
jgi:hypothetical protein